MQILSPVSPTPEQLPILADNRAGFTLIRGAAGSGKTTTALMRLNQLCGYRLARRRRLAVQDPVRVLVLTYNRTLEGYIAQLARDQVPTDPDLHLEVRTFSKWALSLIGDVEILDHDQSRSMLSRTASGFPFDSDFLVDEVDYTLGRFEPSNLGQYPSARRVGRGASPRVDAALRQRLLNDVIAPYQQQKRLRGVVDWNDVANLAGGVSPAESWDVVIVDEAQDFSANQVRTIQRHLAPDYSATFVMDAVQRIYPRFFTWREVGITIAPAQSFTLTANHRNTRQIAAFARPLVEDLPMDDNGALPDFRAAVADGPLPTVLRGTYSDQIDYMLDFVEDTVDLDAESVAFLQPRGGAWFRYLQTELNRRGIGWVKLTRASVWPAGDEAVALCTLHSAKGLEFDHVFMPGLNQQVTPHGTNDGDAQLEALQRLLAMGVGRARRTLMLGYKPRDASTLIALLADGTYEEVTL